MSQLTNGAAFCIAKALHLLSATAELFRQTIVEGEATGTNKMWLNDRARETERIVKIVIERMSKPEMKQELRNDLADPTALSDLMDGFISLNMQNRELLMDKVSDLLTEQVKQNNNEI